MASVEDAGVDWLQGKIMEEVRKMRNGKGRGIGAVSGLGTHWRHRKWRSTAAGRRSSDDEIRRPGGGLGARVWGKRERRRRGLNRRARRAKGGRESPAIKTARNGRGELVTGVIWGRRCDVTACVTVGPTCQRAGERRRAAGTISGRCWAGLGWFGRVGLLSLFFDKTIFFFY